jgi:hypothetical protein
MDLLERVPDRCMGDPDRLKTRRASDRTRTETEPRLKETPNRHPGAFLKA